MYRAYIILGLIFLALCASIANYKYIKNTFLKYFMYFIWYTFIGELTGIIFIKFAIKANIIYNLYSLLYTIFFIIFFRNYIKNNFFKKIATWLMIIFLLGVATNSLFEQHIVNSLQTHTFILGFLIVAVVIILFFIDILNSDAILKLNKLPHFWISVGVFSFTICIVPVMVIANFIGWSGAYDYILLAVNVSMYSCFIYSLMLSKREFNI